MGGLFQVFISKIPDGYGMAVNPNDAIDRHCKPKGIVKHDTITSTRGRQTLRHISESNVYRMIAHSKLPAAEKFEAWVFEDVIPTIRKEGGYVNPAATAEQLAALQAKIDGLQVQLQQEQLYSARVEGERDAWISLVPYGEISSRTGLRRTLDRRGTRCSPRRPKVWFQEHPTLWQRGG